MINGKATIIVDEILADIIVVDEENPLRVICTPVGMPYFNGITTVSYTHLDVYKRQCYNISYLWRV